MSERSYRMFAEDILEAMDKIERYISSLTYEVFAQNEVIVDAVVRNLEIIGEASGNIPEDVKGRHTHIPWKRMIGLRNLIIHRYFRVDLDIIWEIISKNLPETRPMIIEMLREFDERKESNTPD